MRLMSLYVTIKQWLGHCFITTYVVERYSSRTEFTSVQLLVAKTKVGRFTIYRRTIDRETVPSWALIEVAALGSTNWRSKFAEYM